MRLGMRLGVVQLLILLGRPGTELSSLGLVDRANGNHTFNSEIPFGNFGAPFKKCGFPMWGETGGTETPASRIFYSRFLPPSVGAPASLFYFYCTMLCNIAKFFSLFSRFLPLWVSRFRPSPLPPPVPLPPPIRPGSRPLSPFTPMEISVRGEKQSSIYIPSEMSEIFG